eukprot:SAG31_NODE_861_length_11418_cov_5.107430_13_plen_77_part_00
MPPLQKARLTSKLPGFLSAVHETAAEPGASHGFGEWRSGTVKVDLASMLWQVLGSPSMLSDGGGAHEVTIPMPHSC